MESDDGLMDSPVAVKPKKAFNRRRAVQSDSDSDSDSDVNYTGYAASKSSSSGTLGKLDRFAYTPPSTVDLSLSPEAKPKTKAKAEPSGGEWLSRGSEDRHSHIQSMFRKGAKPTKGQKKGGGVSGKSSKSSQPKGKRRRDSEDDESEDSFVVNSDNEEELVSGDESEEESDEDEDDDEDSDDDAARARAKKKKEKKKAAAKAKPQKKAAVFAAAKKKTQKPEEVIDIGSEDTVDSDDSSGAEDEEAEADNHGLVMGEDSDADDEKEVVSKLSKAAEEKLAVCRKISDGLRSALGRWEAAANGGGKDGSGGDGSNGAAATMGQETGCLDLTALSTSAWREDAIEHDDDESSGESEDSQDEQTRSPSGKGGKRQGAQKKKRYSLTSQGEWQPVDAAVIESQCQGLSAIKPYQCVGVNWLLLLHHQNVAGVLADDMGLGKTVQTIGFFAMLRRNAKAKHPRALPPLHLVVVPASVLANWQAELARFAPHIRVLAYHGSPTAREEAKSLLRRSRKDGVGRPDEPPVEVVVTTYTYFERESSSDDRKFLRAQKWSYLVLDEAHGVKNMKTARWNHLKSIKTAHRLLLSGTPVQNNLRELFVLLDFLSPHVFKFKASSGGGKGGWGDEDQSDPIGELLLGLGLGEDGKASSSAGAQGLAAVRQVRTLLAPFVLRRLKAQVLLQLAPKTTVEVVLEAEPSQQQIYDGILRRHVAKQQQQQKSQRGAGKGPAAKKKKDAAAAAEGGGEVVSLVDSPVALKVDPAGESKASGGEGVVKLAGPIDDASVEQLVGSDRDAKHVFTELRKAANHPLLLQVHFRDPAKMATLATKLFGYGHFGDQCSLAMVRTELEGYSDLELHELCAEYGGSLQHLELPIEVLFESAKMRWLRDHVPGMLAEGHRVLIFSQWTSLLSVLELLFAHLDVGFLRLDGSTPVATRQALIDEFNQDKSKGVFLLSTRAGGLGINLTSADTVIMHDLDFNPVNDRQAEDRCHRIGQTKPVTVYKLVTANTVDANILDLGKRKAEVNSALLDDGASSEGTPAAGGKGEVQSMSNMLKNALKSFLT